MMLHTTNFTDEKLYKIMYDLRGVPGTYVAYIRGCRCTSYEQLHAEISASLQFPSYYGGNPPAMSDCIEDLEWLNAKHIYIVIDQAELFLQFDQTQGNAYSRLLERATEYWKDQGQTFRVFLNFTDMPED